MFWGSFFNNLEGFEEITNPPLEMFRLYAPDTAAFIEAGERPGKSVVCTGKIKHPGTSSYISEIQFVQNLLPKEKWGDMKLTLAAPTWYHFRYTEGSAYPKDIYESDEEYFHDVAVAFQVELDILYKAGVRNIQFDDPNFACKGYLLC
jgi:methionine synthase II (cobalamin-independent)